MKETKALNIINSLNSDRIVMTSSFGMQSAVLIHLVQQSNKKEIPIIFLDTQYLFEETYLFMNSLKKRFNLNIKTYRAVEEKQEQENKYNKLWETNLDLYNSINKIEPMNRALDENDVKYWLTGIRSAQSDNRKNKKVLEEKDRYTKVHPLLDWTDRDIHLYLTKYNLPYHPLREKGYLSIGDWHSTKSIHEVDDISETRFNGKQRECGLHK